MLTLSPKKLNFLKLDITVSRCSVRPLSKTISKSSGKSNLTMIG